MFQLQSWGTQNFCLDLNYLLNLLNFFTQLYVGYTFVALAKTFNLLKHILGYLSFEMRQILISQLKVLSSTFAESGIASTSLLVALFGQYLGRFKIFL